jgi:hypothetical protein
VQWKNGRPKRELNCTMLRTSQRLCSKTTHSLPLPVTRKMGIVRVLVRAKVRVVARTALALRPLVVAATKDLDRAVQKTTPGIKCRLLLLSTAGHISNHIRTELRRPLLPPRNSQCMDIRHQTGREMLEMATNSRHNRRGSTTHNQQRVKVVLATSNQCAVMLPIRHTMSLPYLGRSYLRRSSRLILTKHKLGNPLVVRHKLYPLRWWPRLRL